MIIGITGAARSGKSTVAKYLKDLNSEYKIYSLAEELKIEVSMLLPHMDRSQLGWNGIDWTGPKSTIGREILQDHAQEVRAKDPNHWLDIVIEKIGQDKPHHAVIEDVRYCGECEWIKRNDGMIVYIHRPETEQAYIQEDIRTQKQAHQSESQWRAWILANFFDFSSNSRYSKFRVINNNESLNDLNDIAKELDYDIQVLKVNKGQNC